MSYRKIVRERTVRHKDVLWWNEETGVEGHLRSSSRQIGPTLERDYIEGEPELPAEDRKWEERRQIGYWRRLLDAMNWFRNVETI